MSLRRVLMVIALLGVLVQAAASARHNTVMLAGALDAAAERAAFAAVGVALADDSSICRAGSGTRTPDAPEESGLCPICLGAAPAHAVLACPDEAPAQAFSATVERPAVRDVRRAAQKLYRPPARGPPAA